MVASLDNSARSRRLIGDIADQHRRADRAPSPPGAGCATHAPPASTSDACRAAYQRSRTYSGEFLPRTDPRSAGQGDEVVASGSEVRPIR
jgi:hypothetical protein